MASSEQQPVADNAITTGETTPGVPRGSTWEVATLFLKLGFTAFGGPAAHIAMMRDEVVHRRRWIGDGRFLDLVGAVNLIPGPNSTQLALYLGYLRAGWPGLLVAGACFIGPAMLIVLTLAWLYVASGATPQAAWLLYGIKPVVIAIIAQALWGLSKTALHGWLTVVLAALVCALYLLGFNVLALLFGGAVVFALARWASGPRRRERAGISVTKAAPGVGAVARSGAKLLPAAGAGAGVALPFSQLTLFLTFLKIGAVLYGSGYVLLAFLRADFVHGLHWLSDRQLLDAISIGQFTPGPVFTTATFVGYLVGSWPGALVATLAIFLPSFAFVPLLHRVATGLRRRRWTALLLDGVNVAALALMAAVTLQLGRAALRDPLTWALAVGSLVILLRYKPNSAWLIAAGALIGFLAHQ
jgi:chromate transporter